MVSKYGDLTVAVTFNLNPDGYVNQWLGVIYDSQANKRRQRGNNIKFYKNL
jgi:hypothetical protein